MISRDLMGRGKDLPDFYRVRALPKIARHARVSRSLGTSFTIAARGIASTSCISNRNQLCDVLPNAISGLGKLHACTLRLTVPSLLSISLFSSCLPARSLPVHSLHPHFHSFQRSCSPGSDQHKATLVGAIPKQDRPDEAHKTPPS